MIYTVTLNPSIDYVLRLPVLECGGINRCRAAGVYPGGKGVNVSVMLKRLGTDSVAAGFSAGFTGSELERGIEAEGVAADFVRIAEGITRINVKIRAGEETDLNCDGPDISEEDVCRLIDKLSCVRSGDIVVLSGSVPTSLPQDIYGRIMRELPGVRFVADAAGDALLEALKFRPFLIKPNAEELGQIFSVRIETAAAAAGYADRLRDMGAENVLVSMGGTGAVLVGGNGVRYFMPSAKITPVNTVGAGDSMIAGFVAGYLRDGGYEYALRLGTAAGGATASCDGLADGKLVYETLERVGRPERLV